MAAALIAYHYAFSNYSEKVRLVLGLKGLSWRSVDIPPVLPKPDSMPLTGGSSATHFTKRTQLEQGARRHSDTYVAISITA
jgi:hypothetical protein